MADQFIKFFNNCHCEGRTIYCHCEAPTRVSGLWQSQPITDIISKYAKLRLRFPRRSDAPPRNDDLYMFCDDLNHIKCHCEAPTRVSGLWQSQPIAEYCSFYRKTVLHSVCKMNNNDFSKFCLHYSKRCGNIILLRGRSSAGRALEWHSRGQRFDPVRLHHIIKQGHTKSVSLFYNLSLVETDGIEGDRARKRNAKSFLLRVKTVLRTVFRQYVVTPHL